MVQSPPGARIERIAHRGSPHQKLENTLPSFEAALANGADAIELDVHVSSDGVVVVHHDPTAKGLDIASSTWSSLSELDLGNGARVPRLADVLRVVGARATVYIELKGAGVERPALAVARADGLRYAVHSFDHATVERAANLAPEVSRGVLLDRGTPDPIAAMRAAVKRTLARDVWPHESLVSPTFVDVARQIGARVIVWTVNDEAVARRLIHLGVDAICSDDVRMLVNLG
jgi:glycerophosphoryl diester phosphodiesterase